VASNRQHGVGYAGDALAQGVLVVLIPFRLGLRVGGLLAAVVGGGGYRLVLRKVLNVALGLLNQHLLVVAHLLQGLGGFGFEAQFLGLSQEQHNFRLLVGSKWAFVQMGPRISTL